MTAITMPRVRQVPSPNYTPALISHNLVIMHIMEGGYAGSVAWLCDPRAQASVHLCMSEDGAEVSQLVPLQYKAWAQRAFNSAGISIEMPGFTAAGIPEARWHAGALIAAWLCRAYAIPPQWARNGEGKGICQHVDLGLAGGGHHDCCPVGSEPWRTFMGYVISSYNALVDGNFPDFALHGAPNPALVSLPPAVAPEPSHAGADRRDDEDVQNPGHQLFPLGSLSDWQWRLKKVGANPMLVVDGVEGRATRAAIGVFQRACGLPVTNEVNARTWAALTDAAK